MITRKQYMEGACTYDEFYRQFVTADTIRRVVTAIGKDKILASTCEHFNDIPLPLWDALVPRLPGSELVTRAETFYTLGTGVCIAKQAAKMYKDSQKESINGNN